VHGAWCMVLGGWCLVHGGGYLDGGYVDFETV
jgi:hypothetical protein